MKKELEKELRKGKAYCARLLSIRPRSERELNTRLEKAGYSRQARGELILSLKKAGLAGDLDFAKEWIDSRSRTSPRGKALLELELKKKGVPSEVIEEAFRSRKWPLDEKAMALDLAADKMKSLSGQPGEKKKAKIFRFLTGRGFAPDIAEEVVNELLI